MHSPHRNAFDLAGSLSLAGLHAGITLWYRLPVLALACTPLGMMHHAPEVTRMVTEKMAAFAEGLVASQQEMVRSGMDVLTSGLDPAALATASTSVAFAGLRPALRTVRANSRRLSQRR